MYNDESGGSSFLSFPFVRVGQLFTNLKVIAWVLYSVQYLQKVNVNQKQGCSLKEP